MIPKELDIDIYNPHKTPHRKGVGLFWECRKQSHRSTNQSY